MTLGFILNVVLYYHGDCNCGWPEISNTLCEAQTKRQYCMVFVAAHETNSEWAFITLRCTESPWGCALFVPTLGKEYGMSTAMYTSEIIQRRIARMTTTLKTKN